MLDTQQQLDFYSALLSLDRNIILQARAGCGKTTSIIQAVIRYLAAYPNAEILIVAYNKEIADELSTKLKALGIDWRRATASTIHSAAFGLCKTRFGRGIKVEENKVRDIVRSLSYKNGAPFDPESPYTIYSKQIQSLVAVAKQAGIGCFPDTAIKDNSAWSTLMAHFDINGFQCDLDRDKVIDCSRNVYTLSLANTQVLDFDDMVLFPLYYNILCLYSKDHVFVDEAQDLSRVRQAVSKKFIRPITGRMSIIGDSAQSIYGFSGADCEAMSNMATDLDAITLPLSLTWRCPKSIVSLVKHIVPDFEAVESAIEGEILYTEKLDYATLSPTDAILCRNTSPLIEIAYDLISRGIPCKVEGRKIGEGLIALVNRWKISTTEELHTKLDELESRETQKALDSGDESKLGNILDKINSIRVIIETLNSQRKFLVSDVVSHIQSLFADGVRGVTTLMTYHRSKGREFDRVLLIDDAKLCPSRYAKQDWQKRQETFLWYVACTRTKRVLTFVDRPDKKDKKG